MSRSQIPSDEEFSTLTGICSSKSSLVAVEANAPVAVRTEFTLDNLTGGLKAEAVAEKPLPTCKNPTQVSAVVHTGPKR